MSAVVDKGVNGLLQHSLFVPDYNVGSSKLKELFKTVVSVDYSPVKVVKVGGREASAFKLNHGAKVGRNNGDDIENHPLGTVARLLKCLNNLKTL